MNENINEISALLRSLAFAGRGAADTWVRESGLTRQQAFALGYIERFQEHGVIARDLADMSGTTPASVTSLIQGLEQRGLVERRPSPTDSRVKLILVTEAGAAAVAGFGDDMSAAQAKVYEALSEEELDTLLELLRKIAASQPEGFGEQAGPGFGGFEGRGFGRPGHPGPGFGGRGPRGHRGGRGFGPGGFGGPGEDELEDESRGRRGARGPRGGKGFGGRGFGGPGAGPEASPDGGPDFRGGKGYRGGFPRRGPWTR